jgi:hypothetical protein
VIEGKSVQAHGGVERLFSGVAERWMADVVDQSQRFGEVIVEPELGGDGARDLRNFDGMSQAVAKMVGIAASKDLGLSFETAKSARVHNTVAIALEIVAVRMMRFGMAASAGPFYANGVVGELGVSGQLPVPCCQFTASV